MKKIIVYIFLVIVLSFSAIVIYTELPFVSNRAVGQALSALRKYLGEELNEGTLIIVDYSRPSHTKCMAVIDLKTGAALANLRVTHGKNSGIVVPTEFSNIAGSFKSSLGLFKVAHAFDGKHGPSLRLLGLEPGINDNALNRGIIVHSAPYASKNSMLLNWKQGFRLGRSEGCFVLSSNDYGVLNSVLEKPLYLYSYANIQSR
jgi:hypothetical protein